MGGPKKQQPTNCAAFLCPFVRLQSLHSFYPGAVCCHPGAPAKRRLPGGRNPLWLLPEPEYGGPRSLHGTHLGGPLTYFNSHLGCEKQPFRNNQHKCGYRRDIFATYQRIDLCCTTALIPNTRRLKNTSPPFKNGFRKKAAPYTKYATKLKTGRQRRDSARLCALCLGATPPQGGEASRFGTRQRTGSAPYRKVALQSGRHQPNEIQSEGLASPWFLEPAPTQRLPHRNGHAGQLLCRSTTKQSPLGHYSVGLVQTALPKIPSSEKKHHPPPKKFGICPLKH